MFISLLGLERQKPILKEPQQVNSTQLNLALESPVKESTLDKISDESFIRHEKLCEKSVNKTMNKTNIDLLKDVIVPEFNDTLEEVDFILKLGLKLKEEKKIKCVTPQPTIKYPLVSSYEHSQIQMNIMAHSSPKENLLHPNHNRDRLSNIISPIHADTRYEHLVSLD